MTADLTTEESPAEPSSLAGFERYRRLVDDPQAFVAALERPLPVCIWAHPRRIAPEDLAARLRPAGLDAKPLPWYPQALRLPAETQPGNRLEYVTGLFHVQEEVSLLPVTLLDPQPGERILDLCAAPGNKTAQIAFRVGDTGCVVANDRNLGRMSILRRALDRLGVTNCVTTVYDGGNFSNEAGAFDRVLADVPCSCEGTSRKSSQEWDPQRRSRPGSLSSVQWALLRKAVQLCKVGGRIVYSTCTYAPEENEQVVQRALEAFPGCLEVREARIEGFRSAPGLVAWQDKRFDPSLEGALRAFPHHNDTGGFFVAVLEKVAATGRDAPAPPPPPELREEDTSRHWFGHLEERYGVSPEHFANLRLFRANKRYLNAAATGLQPPARPESHTLGMPFLHTDMAQPKLTTAGAFYLAPAARRNVVDLDQPQTDAFLHRQKIDLTADQQAELEPGHVLVRYRDTGSRAALGSLAELLVGLGIGSYRPDEGTLRSLFPKGWALAEERSAFD
ncbi:MAG: RsmB/NOP family class I SAM-dependent RNA methyltransferase [Acidobacteriota bacterium]|nr:RsmB/NOP family class I SAM-dependent RNA methyltransferase [Acidobacteriota bacterium]